MKIHNAGNVPLPQTPSQSQSQTSSIDSKPSVDLAVGTLSGVAQVISGQPLDTIKVQMQVPAAAHKAQSDSMMTITRKIFKNQGPKGFFRGMASPLAFFPAINSVTFWGYGIGERQLEAQGISSHIRPFLSGAFAGVVQGPLMAAGDISKILLQKKAAEPGQNKQAGSIKVLLDLVKKRGPLALTRGLGATLLRDVPGYGIYFGTYEASRRAFTKDGETPSTLGTMAAGSLAGMTSWFITYPFDIVKTRLQAARSGTYKGIIDCGRKLIQAEGIQGLKRGLGTTVLRAAPTNAFGFAVAEALRERLLHQE